MWEGMWGWRRSPEMEEKAEVITSLRKWQVNYKVPFIHREGGSVLQQHPVHTITKIPLRSIAFGQYILTPNSSQPSTFFNIQGAPLHSIRHLMHQTQNITMMRLLLDYYYQWTFLVSVGHIFRTFVILFIFIFIYMNGPLKGTNCIQKSFDGIFILPDKV